MARAAVPRVRCRTVKRVDSTGFVVRKGIQCSAGKSNTPQREGAPPSGRSDPQASTSLRWTKRRVPGADKSLTAAPAEAGAMEQAAGARLRPLRVTGQASRRSICPRDIRPVGLERSAQMTAVRRLIPGTAVIIALIQRQRRQLKGMPTRADVVRALPALQVGDLLEALSADCRPLTARRSPGSHRLPRHRAAVGARSVRRGPGHGVPGARRPGATSSFFGRSARAKTASARASPDLACTAFGPRGPACARPHVSYEADRDQRVRSENLRAETSMPQRPPCRGRAGSPAVPSMPPSRRRS